MSRIFEAISKISNDWNDNILGNNKIVKCETRSSRRYALRCAKQFTQKKIISSGNDLLISTS
jgi:hypothetical protein